MRMNKTAIALTTAAALGVGIMPAANAQEGSRVNDPSIQRAGDSANDADTSIFGNGTGEGEANVPGNRPADPAEGVFPGQPQPGSEPTQSNSFGTKEPSSPVESPKPSSTKTPETNTHTTTTTSTAPATNTATTTAPATTTSTMDPEKKRAIILGSLGAVAGLGLIIAGVRYFVNKDGDLVKDQNRVNEPASPEEKAESDRLKREHGDEIANQVEATGGVNNAGTGNAGTAGTGNAAANNGTAANGERGMSASTGVTKLPAGLIALLILSVLGAAGYAYTRRQTA